MNIAPEEMPREIERLEDENEELQQILDRAIKYVESLSSKGRDCDIYDDIKQEILRKLKGKD